MSLSPDEKRLVAPSPWIVEKRHLENRGEDGSLSSHDRWPLRWVGMGWSMMGVGGRSRRVGLGVSPCETAGSVSVSPTFPSESFIWVGGSELCSLRPRVSANGGWLVRSGRLLDRRSETVGWYAVEEYGAAVAAAGVGRLWKVIVGGGGGRKGVGTMWKIIWTKIVVWSHYQWHLLLCGVEHCMVA